MLYNIYYVIQLKLDTFFTVMYSLNQSLPKRAINCKGAIGEP